MQRRVNLRLLLVSVATLLVLGVGIWLLHGYQVRRNAHYLLQRADEARADDVFSTALTYYGQYLTLVPGDTEAGEKFALTLDKVADDANDRVRVVLRFEEILRRDPERIEVRYRL